MRMSLWRKPPLPEERRHALEQWVRVRFQLLESDPLIAIIGAVARLTDEGLAHREAMDLVLAIVREGDPQEL